jgi:hypothetical protein
MSYVKQQPVSDAFRRMSLGQGSTSDMLNEGAVSSCTPLRRSHLEWRPTDYLEPGSEILGQWQDQQENIVPLRKGTEWKRT